MLGYTRQAYYKSRRDKFSADTDLLSYLKDRRKELPFEGIKKIHVFTVRNSDFKVSRDHLTELLQQNALIINRKRKYLVLTDSANSNNFHENLIKNTTTKHVFEVLVSDLTYLKTKQRVYYLTAIMELHSRMILSYVLRDNKGTEGLISAFLLIAREYEEKLKGCIFHSDRGSEFLSPRFEELAVKNYGMILSNSRKGNPYDNSCMERLFSTLKSEYMLRITFPDVNSLMAAVKRAVYSYNNIRLHWSLGLMTPKAFFLEQLKSY